MRSLHIDCGLNPCDTAGFDLAVSLGGDGTFLSAVRKMDQGGYRPILGINSGRLGFLSSSQLENAAKALQALLDGRYNMEPRAMLEVRGIEQCAKTKALNEFTVQKSGTSMIFLELEIDGVPVAAYWADGIIISTPTGSTAYSMSVGGSILTPLCGCFIVSPIAPHNLSLRPLVVRDSAKIVVKASARHNETTVTTTIDNYEYKVSGENKFTITRSHDNLQVVNLLDNNFYATLREKLHWGIDPR